MARSVMAAVPRRLALTQYDVRRGRLVQGTTAKFQRDHGLGKEVPGRGKHPCRERYRLDLYHFDTDEERRQITRAGFPWASVATTRSSCQTSTSQPSTH